MARVRAVMGVVFLIFGLESAGIVSRRYPASTSPIFQGFI
jgi:hypothetical protein